MRIAIADIGTNSTRLLIGEVDDRRITAQIERDTTVTRLGAGVDGSGRLRRDAMERVHGTLQRYRGRTTRMRRSRRMRCSQAQSEMPPTARSSRRRSESGTG